MGLVDPARERTPARMTGPQSRSRPRAALSDKAGEAVQNLRGCLQASQWR